MSVQDLIADPQFQQLSPSDKQAALAGVDPEFKNIGVNEVDHVVQSIGIQPQKPSFLQSLGKAAGKVVGSIFGPAGEAVGTLAGANPTEAAKVAIGVGVPLASGIAAAPLGAIPALGMAGLAGAGASGYQQAIDQVTGKQQGTDYKTMGINAGANMAGEGAVRGLQAVLPSTSDVAVDSGRRALGFIKSEIKKAGGLDAANTVAKEMVDKNVIPWMGGAQTMLDRAEAVAKEAGAKIGTVVKGLDESGVKAFDTTDVGMELLNQTQKSFKSPQAQSAINKAIETISNYGKGEISFEDAQALKKELQGLTSYGEGSDSVQNMVYKKAAGIVRQAIDNKVTQAVTNNPEFFQNKSVYGAAKAAQVPIKGRMNALAGNNAISLYDIILASHALASGNIPGALGTIGALEGMKRSGAAITSNIANSIGNQGSNVGRTSFQAILAAAKVRQAQR